ncbi:MAG: DUF72 domain-containing protein [Acidobacteria bacterium]|jgi:uncharacterized protein YecE (DUF72 family)|nr:DUF72 domain-containing protein [Acidobacteriota bacterium]
MQVRVGTSGFSYKEWKGSFYPADIKSADMLRYYGERFSAVEVNNTFYRMPRASMLEGWAEQVPPDFLFVLKASQQITHRKRLKDASEPLAYLLEAAATLGDRLGPVLFQLPPHLKKDVDRLRDFLALLPDGPRFAFEFRHQTWSDAEVHAALRERNCALVCADTEDAGENGAPIVPTAAWGYLRLRRCDYTAEELRPWADRVRAQPWERAFVFFKHEEGRPLAWETIRAFKDELS